VADDGQYRGRCGVCEARYEQNNLSYQSLGHLRRGHNRPESQKVQTMTSGACWCPGRLVRQHITMGGKASQKGMAIVAAKDA
jgi:hypothetical protein